MMTGSRNHAKILNVLSIALLATACGAGCGENKGVQKILPPPTPPPLVPRAVVMPIKPELRGAARVEIQNAMASSDPVLRANAVEAIQRGLGVDGKADIIKALDDKSTVVRFAACMAVGDLRIKEAQPMLLKLAEDPTARVQIGARFALHRIGDTRRSQQLAAYTRDMSEKTRSDAALALGLLGEPTGVRLLRPMMTDVSPAVKLQVAEALWRLQSEDGLDYLLGAIVSQAADDQIVAVLALSWPKDRRVIEHVRGRLTSDYDEIALTAARAMGILGSDDGYGVALKGAKSADGRQRSLAALALGSIGRSDAQPVLEKLLIDAEPLVRISAAVAILQLKPAPSVAGQN